MNTNNLIHLLKLASVNKANEHCILTNDGEIVTAKASTPDVSLITRVYLKDDFPIDDDLGIYDMEKLVKILGLHDQEVTMKIAKNKLNIKDKKLTSDYILTSLQFLKVKKLKGEPEYDLEILLTEEVIKQLIAAMKVLSDGNIVSILPGEEESIMSVGSKTDFSNKISFNVPTKFNVENSIYEIFYLNLQLVKQVMETNSSCKDAKILVCEQGIVTFVFKYENIKAEYNLIMLEM